MTEIFKDHLNGVAFQINKNNLKSYDGKYMSYCNEKYKDKDFSDKINEFRTNLVKKHIGDTKNKLVDIGIGNGSFIEYYESETGKIALGYDIDDEAVDWLSKRNKLATKLQAYEIFTLWDVLEHMPDPSYFLGSLVSAEVILISIPIFNHLGEIFESKHYRPDEHLWYFTEKGLVKFMADKKFSVVEISDGEEKIGREGIKTYVFKR